MNGHVDDLLLALVERRLPPAERARVAAHLDACPRCRKVASDLADTSGGLAALPAAVRSLPVRAAKHWPSVWARVRAAGPRGKLGPQVTVYLGLVTSLFAVVSIVPGVSHGGPASVTAGVAAGPRLTQPATVVFHTADTLGVPGTRAQPLAGAAPALTGTEAIAPKPIPTPVPGP